jgi:branched-chain amino acid transport system permease protein
VIGIRLMRTKLLAFAVSSFYCGVAGALYAFAYLGTVEPEGFNLDLSFRILFMIIIGGVGSILGPSWARPSSCCCRSSSTTWCRRSLVIGLGINLPSGHLDFQLIVFGGLIIFFLIVEPHGLARLWQIGKEKLRLWPFPH